jgi:hypothetical protein
MPSSVGLRVDLPSASSRYDSRGSPTAELSRWLRYSDGESLFGRSPGRPHPPTHRAATSRTC